VQLFINGLQDRECATALQQRLQFTSASEVNLDWAKEQVMLYQESKQQQLQVQAESSVAASMLGKAAGKTLLPGTLPEGQLTEHQRTQFMLQQAKQLGLPEDHNFAVCMLPRHSNHCILQCRDLGIASSSPHQPLVHMAAAAATAVALA
jgi:hypothetical protein